MKRKTSSLPTRLYKYALRAPSANAELVHEQLRLARGYRNTLIELELRSRAAYRKARAEIAPIGALEERIAERSSQLQALRGRRSDDALRLRQELRELRVQLRAELQAARTQLREMALRIRAETLATFKEARKRSGVYWGTYQLVEQAVEQMRRAPADPRFERWDGRGSVGVQLSGGIAAGDVFGKDTRLRVDPIAQDTFDHPGRSYRTRHRLTTLHLRIGSQEGGKPVWASWPLIFDRPLPPDGRVKSAWVTRRYVGTHVKWELCIAIEAESFLPPPRRSPQRTAASIHFSSHQTAHGMRVACVYGSDGALREIYVPPRFLERHAQCKRLAEQRTRELRAASEALLSFVTQPDVPSWLLERTRELATPARGAQLRALAIDWRARRFAGDEQAYQALEAWRKRERHLLEWQVNSRDKAHLHRREHFRLAARELALRYGTLVLDDTDFRRPRGDAAHARPERQQRALAACGELRAILKYMAEKHGCRVHVLPAVTLGRACHACGAPVEREPGLAQQRCERCDASWDVDENAARLLLGRAALLEAAE